MARNTSLGKIAASLMSGFGGDFGRLESVTVHVFVDQMCPVYLVQTVRLALVPARTSASVEVLNLDATGTKVPDVVIFLSGGDTQVGEKCAYLASCGIPVAMVVESAVETPHMNVSTEAAAHINILAGTSSEALLERLATWLGSATEKGVFFAASFPFCREAFVTSLITQCATANAAIGAVTLIPGSDMAFMTASQVRLALDIASAYGLNSRTERIPELAGVVSAGFVYRSAARVIAGMVPGFGWLAKASIGYFGTKATARGIVEHIKILKETEGQPQVEG